MNIRSKFALLVWLMSVAAWSNAQITPANSEKVVRPQSESGMGQQDPELVKALNLSKEQHEQFKKIGQESHAKAKAVKAAKREELNKIREERMAAQRAILSAEQARKYDELMAKRQAEKEARKAAKKEERKMEKKATKAKQPKSANGQE